MIGSRRGLGPAALRSLADEWVMAMYTFLCIHRMCFLVARGGILPKREGMDYDFQPYSRDVSRLNTGWNMKFKPITAAKQSI